MTAEDAPLTLHARLVFPVAGKPIAGGMVAIRGSRIVGVGPRLAEGPIRDLGDVAIVPGLINAHCHLEFSHLTDPLGAAGISLPDWIRLTIAARRDATNADRVAAVARGLGESLACGTTTLGDIATSDWRHAEGIPSTRRPRVCMFHESIAPLAGRVRETVATAERFLENPSAEGIQPGLSPHAPYTVRPELFEDLVQLARQYDVPLAMHLAESREELELLNSSDGPFCELLQELNSWDPLPSARLRRVLDYLQTLVRAPRSLLIRGNYLDEPAIRFLAVHADRASVVFCPRTHQYFRHTPYPLARMLNAGVAMALGTDGRGSNPDLNMLDEMRCVAIGHSELSYATVLSLATREGARALGIADQVGTLEPGKLADMAVIRLDSSAVNDPHESILLPGARVVQTWIGGELVHAADDHPRDPRATL